mmetsp:Transcript_14574/g.16828  ORF Transcript_14574/g.16828 Transcript_14574/m.16828 type:complete len:190 (+) Transcript_14574:114-683(+)
MKMNASTIEKTNPMGCDEFIVPKNYKQVILNITTVLNSKVLFSNISKKSEVCPNGDSVDYSNSKVNVGEICQNDITCTLFEKIDLPFRFRAEQCFEQLYVLMVYPLPDEANPQTMKIYAEYINNEPCFTVTGGIHDVINTETDCGKKAAEDCEKTVRCALVTCKYPSARNKNETVCLPRATSESTREQY